jgi:hypothetical protein
MQDPCRLKNHELSVNTAVGLSQHYQQHIMAQPTLPDDILHVLCEELANQDQFDTLFNCACSSRVLAVPALTHLYRYVTCQAHLVISLRSQCDLSVS